MKKVNQKGFSLIEILIVLVVLGLLGAVGWYVWMQHTKSKPTTSTTSSSASQVTPPSTSSSASAPTYLNITELGIKVKLNDDTRDLTYAKTKDGTIGISTKSLEAFGVGCNAETGDVAIIYTFTDPSGSDPFEGSHTNMDVFPKALKLNGKYYALNYGGISQSPCVDISKADDNFSATVKKVKNGFSQATLEKI